MGSLVVTLSVLILMVHTLGYCFEKLRQPRVIGEILAGVLVGPFVLGRLAPGVAASLFGGSSPDNKTQVVLNFFYWIGLLLLMFLSGAETRRFMARENRRETAWFLGVGMTLPFLLVFALGWWSFLPLASITGTSGRPVPALLVLSIAVAVTSIPVISRIFFDLGVMHTRFASLILSFAVLEDIALWGVLAVATGIVSAQGVSGGQQAWQIATHTAASFAYMGVGLFVAPRLLRMLHDAPWNILLKASPVGYLFVLLFLYVAVAGALGVNFVFAAFLAGFGLVGGLAGTERARFAPQLDATSQVAKAVFIPVYFALVGYKLILGRDFSLPMLVLFLFASSLVAILSFACAARLAGFRGLDVMNLAMAKNARGGPGIVLASVAFEAGIINAPFYTTLVLTAVLTSQTTGAWLRFVLSKGWPLLSAHPEETWTPAQSKPSAPLPQPLPAAACLKAAAH